MILRDHRAVLPVSTYVEGYHGISGLCLGVPALLGREGVVETLEIPLTAEEQERLAGSAQTLKAFLAEIGF